MSHDESPAANGVRENVKLGESVLRDDTRVSRYLSVSACSLNSEGFRMQPRPSRLDPLIHSRNWALVELRLTRITLVEATALRSQARARPDQ
jgi:hypothetical protein